jgi:hypothetical protein
MQYVDLWARTHLAATSDRAAPGQPDPVVSQQPVTAECP